MLTYIYTQIKESGSAGLRTGTITRILMGYKLVRRLRTSLRVQAVASDLLPPPQPTPTDLQTLHDHVCSARQGGFVYVEPIQLPWQQHQAVMGPRCTASTWASRLLVL